MANGLNSSAGGSGGPSNGNGGLGLGGGIGGVTGGAVPGQAFLLKFEDFQFDATFHDKYIALESIMGPRSIESPRMMPPMPQGGQGQRVSNISRFYPVVYFPSRDFD